MIIFYVDGYTQGDSSVSINPKIRNYTNYK
jgi:hypothetical protein